MRSHIILRETLISKRIRLEFLFSTLAFVYSALLECRIILVIYQIDNNNILL